MIRDKEPWKSRMFSRTLFTVEQISISTHKIVVCLNFMRFFIHISKSLLNFLGIKLGALKAPEHSWWSYIVWGEKLGRDEMQLHFERTSKFQIHVGLTFLSISPIKSLSHSQTRHRFAHKFLLMLKGSGTLPETCYTRYSIEAPESFFMFQPASLGDTKS